MSLRNIPASFDPEVVRQIDERLDGIERDNGVVVVLAIESGSRAWGFPSPDSDYDCRFIYVRPQQDYLSLFPKRDVIETPLQGVFDVNGWDIGKALQLLLKGNAVVVEWLTSPVVYKGDDAFRSAFSLLARRHLNRTLVARHYLHLGERQRKAYFADGKTVRLKKLFYALRPAAALRWLRLHPSDNIAPMNFPILMSESDIPTGVMKIVGDLIVQKSKTRELGEGLLPDAIAEFIDAEFREAEYSFSDDSRTVTDEARQDVDEFFRNSLSRCFESEVGG
jgi:hypothetical protein